MIGGGKIDMGAGWAMEWWLLLLPELSPGIIKPVGRAAGVRIYSDARTADGGVAAVALFPKRAGEFAVLLKGNAKQLLPECISETNEILEQLGGKRTVLFLDTKAGSIREQLGEQAGRVQRRRAPSSEHLQKFR